MASLHYKVIREDFGREPVDECGLCFDDWPCIGYKFDKLEVDTFKLRAALDDIFVIANRYDEKPSVKVRQIVAVFKTIIGVYP